MPNRDLNTHNDVKNKDVSYRRYKKNNCDLLKEVLKDNKSLL